MYAILDIETTGGKFNEEGITEIAIHKFDGHTVVDSFISLVNPEREIQEFVVKLTGINSKMLRNAPKFYEIAKRIVEITKDCTLVAHNSAFDYRILKTEFRRLEYDYNRNTLCTVELSKVLIPDESSYSLGKLVKSLGIPITDRHRANGDALATVQLFKLLLEKDVQKNIIQDSVKNFDKSLELKKLITISDDVPAKEGVFYLHREDGKVIYLGRGKNMKNEIQKLFAKESKRSNRIRNNVVSFSYEETGNELLTKLKYYTELEILNPKFNFKKRKKLIEEDFNSDNMLLIDKGRIVEENAVILVEENQVLGYTFTNLAFQENQLDILKKMMTPIENKILAKTIVKNHLRTKTVSKIVRY